MVEILVVVALFSVILGLGLFIGFDFYRNYSSRSEEEIIVSVLQKARNQSLNNINQTRHGVHFATDPLRYIIFAEDGSIADNVIGSSYGITITNPLPPFDVVFDQLNGNCANCPIDITVNYGNNNYEISINSEGRISW